MSEDCARCKRREQRRKARTIETRDVFGQLERSVIALGKRVAAGDPEDLAQLLALRRAVDDATRVGVDGLREQGHSDNELARVAGLGSRQAVRSRWPHATPAADTPPIAWNGALAQAVSGTNTTVQEVHGWPVVVDSRMPTRTVALISDHDAVVRELG